MKWQWMVPNYEIVELIARMQRLMDKIDLQFAYKRAIPYTGMSRTTYTILQLS